jgi:hypothetical protein
VVIAIRRAGVNGAADFPCMSRFRLKRLGLILAGLSAGGAAVWFFFFPVPVGGLLRLAAGRAGAAERGAAVLLERATFRWCWGEPALRLEVAGLAVRRGGEPLADVAALTVELEKRAWWSSGYAPARVGLEGARVAVDLRPTEADGPARAPAATATPAAQPLAALEPVLAPLAALWPRDGAGTVVNADGLRLVLRTGAGTAEWRWAKLEARARRVGAGMELAFDAALAGAGAPRAEVRARHLPAARRLTVALRVPQFDPAVLPAWPGAPERPIRAQVEAEAEGEIELGTGKVVRGAAMLAVADGRLTLPDLAAPIPVPRAVLRLRADGDPLRIEVVEAVIEVSGARLAAERMVAVLGDTPRLEGGAVLESVSAAAWVALLPVELRRQLPIGADAVAELWLKRATVRGAVDLRAPRDGIWNPRALRGEGEIVAVNAGRELAATWQAAQGDDGVTTVRTALAPTVFAEWGGASMQGSVAAALQLPVAVQAEATIEASGEVRAANVVITAGPGQVGAWGPLPRAVAVKRVALRAELADAGRRVRVPQLILETDGPALELAEVDVAWPRDRPVAVRGRGRVGGLGAAWVEPWLPQGALAALSTLGLAPGDVGIAQATTTWEAVLAEGAGGALKPTGGAVVLDTEIALRHARVPVRAEARWRPADERAEVEVRAGPFEPAALPIVVPAGVPPLAHFALPVELKGAASVGLDGAPAQLRFGIEAGPGTVRALPQWPVDVPVRSLRAAGGLSADGMRATVETLAVEIGAGLTLGGRELRWQAAARPTVSGELSLGAVALPALFPLLPPALATDARGWLQAGELRGARVRFAASPDAQAPAGWRIAELRGETTLAALAGTVPGAGTAGAERVRLEIDYPRVRATVGGATLPAFFRGPLDIGAELDAARPDAPRASVRLSGETIRLAAPGWAAVPLLGAPLQLTAARAGQEAVEFAVESERALGRALRLNGRAEAGRDGARAVELARLEFGATALAGTAREAADGTRTVRVRGARLALEELLQTAAPWLQSSQAAIAADGAKKPETGVAEPAPTGTRRPADGKSPRAERTEIGIELDAVSLGGGKALAEVRAGARLRDGWPERAEFAAKEGTGNALRVTLGEGTEGTAQPVAVAIDDASAWVAALTTPLKALALPPELAATVATVAQVPTLVAGGRVEIAGEWAGRSRFTGRVSVGQATMVQAPRILQLLALKSGKALTQRPLLEQLTIGRVTADERAITVDGVTLAGTGLIDRLKLNSARYEIPTQAVAVDGLYFGVGFEVVGTRADPQVFLKDSSLLVRTVGQRNEFDFEAMAREAEEAKAKAAPAKP